ncbi:DedA family protein [Prauserella endophytica]|uniref:DedA family protein n=1 Tax=Prauserella endophytica TaxID=1592324 RepID=A0ABY2SEQ0_9PSEU|nr:DedA family protein [Prauserella endophytica]TKG73619.1 DedA family protein [Prauserella endophytica]
MFELLDRLTAMLQAQLDSPWLWLIIFVVAGLDALLPFMPSETTVMTVAVLLGPDLPGLAVLTVVAATGAWAGDLLGHGIARRAGPGTLRRLQRNEQGRRRYEWAKEKVHRHGTVLIVAGRYLPGGRVASALATGSLRYPLGRFAVLDAIGVTVWAVYSVLVGYLGSARFADEPVKGLLFAFGIGLLAVGCVELGRRLVSRRGVRGVPRGDRDPQRRPAGRRGRGRTGSPGAVLSEVDGEAAGATHRQGAFLGGRRDGGSER